MTVLALMFSLQFTVDIHAAEAEETTSFDLTIMHMNDTHAHVGPMPQMITAIKGIRAENPDALLFHAGDVFSGTLYFNEFRGQADMALLNLMGVDAMTFGNHEFDLGDQEGGQASLAEFVKAANFPFVGTNVHFANDPFMSELETGQSVAEDPQGGEIYNSIVKEIDGEKIGIFGLTTEDTINIASPLDVTFSNYKEAAKQAVKEFEDAGINKIIAITHLGHKSNPAVGNDLLLGQVDGIDVIVGGHSHTKVEPPVIADTDEFGNAKDPTIIVQAYQYAEFLGKLDVTFDGDGVVTKYAGELLSVADYDADEEALQSLQPYKDQVEEVMNEKIGAEAVKNLTNPRQVEEGKGDSVRANETALGNLVTDAMLAKAKVKYPEIQIAFQNGGGIREAIPKGQITAGQVISVLPFGNSPVMMELTGAEIMEALEHSVSQSPAESGAFLHVAGMKFTFDSTKNVGARVVDVLVNQDGKFVPLEETATYFVTTNVFTAGGGDGFDVFARATNEGRVSDLGEIDWEQLRDYMVEDLKGVVDPEIEGRIINLKGKEPEEPITIASIEQDIEDYKQSGDMEHPLAKKLTNKLKQVEHHLEKGHDKQAVKQMEDFLKHVNNKTMDKFITQEAKDNLNESANILLENLKNNSY
jgi:2',3'-cyclic-nucleotide 2'-phosphodiesterase (5'-nucleotidase family)